MTPKEFPESDESPREACANMAMTLGALADEYEKVRVVDTTAVGWEMASVETLRAWATRLERACAKLDQERVRVAAAEQDTRRLRESFQELIDICNESDDWYNDVALDKARAALGAIPQEEPQK